MSRPRFQHLSPGPGEQPISGDDPMAEAVFLVLRRGGMSPDQANATINATLERVSAHVSASGEPMSLDDAADLLREQLAAEGVSADKAEAVTNQVRQAITTPRGSVEDVLDPANIAAIEDSLSAALEDGRLSEDQFVALVTNAHDAEGVRYAAEAAKFMEGRAPRPPVHPDMPDFNPDELKGAQDRGDDPGGTQDDSTRDGALQDDEAPADQQQHDQQPQTEDDTMPHDDEPTEDTAEQKAAKAKAYARVNDPKYHERGPEGDLFRQETDAMFEQAFGTESAGETGRSDPGYGV